jgi:hypothetical protein
MTNAELVMIMKQRIADGSLSAHFVMHHARIADADTAWTSSCIYRSDALKTINEERNDKGLQPLDAIPQDDWDMFVFGFSDHHLVSGDDEDAEEVAKELLAHLI